MPTKQEYKDQHKVSRVELHWPHSEPLNPESDIADVVVHMEDGSRYRGTVTTPQFIKDTMNRAKTEDSTDIEGDYWFGDAIIMQRIDETRLSTIVVDLIDSFMFEKAFHRAEAATMA